MQKKGPPSAVDKEEAERLKTEGNNLMRTEKFAEALNMYTQVCKRAINRHKEPREVREPTY